MKIDRQLWMVCLILALAVFSSGCARETGVEAAREGDQAGVATDQPTVSPAEQDFMMKVTQANVAEIMLARQALQKSSNADVKEFAHMLEADHMKTLDRMAGLMMEMNVTQSRVLTTDTAQELDRMHRLSSADFDREFANLMVEKHKESIELFRDQIQTAQNAAVREFATETLPTLEMHLQKALGLQSELFRGDAR